jgi:hypothetical protein
MCKDFTKKQFTHHQSAGDSKVTAQYVNQIAQIHKIDLTEHKLPL